MLAFVNALTLPLHDPSAVEGCPARLAVNEEDLVVVYHLEAVPADLQRRHTLVAALLCRRRQLRLALRALAQPILVQQ